MKPGALIISLDFELYWGVRDCMNLTDYKDNLLGVRKVIPAILELFDKYGIHATWSTVGFLFFETKEELMENIPDLIPDYENIKLSPYKDMSTTVGEDEEMDPFHFAPSIIKEILTYPNQKVGTHTFSHYYCLEPGQNIHSFRSDILSALKVAKKKGIHIESIVFPCNQYNKEYIKVCESLGITSYRGNELSWLYSARNREDESLLRKALRFIDSYINLSGYNTYTWDYISKEYPINIPSSRFLRPYSKKLKALMPLKLNRIKKDLTYAAQNNQIYHLWWHPHNFGVNIEENLDTLEEVLRHFSILQHQYDFQSLNMEEVSDMVLEVDRYEASKSSDVR